MCAGVSIATVKVVNIRHPQHVSLVSLCRWFWGVFFFFAIRTVNPRPTLVTNDDVRNTMLVTRGALELTHLGPELYSLD